jgi:hypothetical protein
MQLGTADRIWRLKKIFVFFMTSKLRTHSVKWNVEAMRSKTVIFLREWLLELSLDMNKAVINLLWILNK